MDAFSDLIAQTGTLLGIDEFSPDAEGVCIIASEDAEILIVNCPDAGDMVLVTATLMPLPPDADAAITAALQANFRFEATNGATVSLDAESDSLALSRYIPLASLTPESLLDRIEEFSSALFSLRTTLAEMGGVRDAAPPNNAADEIAIDGETIQLRHEDDGSTFASIDIGELPPSEDGGSALARELLESNHLFAGTAGATLAIDSEANRVLLQRRIYPQDNAPEDLLPTILAVLTDKASEWRSRLQSHAEQPESLSPFSFGFMQV